MADENTAVPAAEATAPAVAKKAYDLAALGEKLKVQGLEIGEEGLRALITSLFEWLRESAEVSETPLDDMAAVVYPHLEKAALGLVDKISAKV